MRLVKICRRDDLLTDCDHTMVEAMPRFGATAEFKRDFSKKTGLERCHDQCKRACGSWRKFCRRLSERQSFKAMKPSHNLQKQ